MSMFLSVMAFLLSVAAVVVGAEALRRINGQNEEFLKSYVDEIRRDLQQKDQQLAILRRDLTALRANRSINRETLRSLEQNAARKRQMVAATAPAEEPDRFVPSLDRARKRYVV